MAGEDNKKDNNESGYGMMSSGARAGIGALLGGGLGALSGAYLTDAPEDMTPSEVFKARLENTIVTGLLGALGGAGAGYASGELGIGGEAPTMDDKRDVLIDKYGPENGWDTLLKRGVPGVTGIWLGSKIGGKINATPVLKTKITAGGGIGGALGGGLGAIGGPYLFDAAEDWFDSRTTKD